MKGITNRYAQISSVCLLTWSGMVLAQSQLNVLEVEGELQRAVGPVELVKIEAQGQLSMRALRAFDRLPDSFMALAMELRRADIDLLAATVDEVRALQPRVEDGSLKVDKEAYNALLAALDNQKYLEWVPVEQGQILNADEPLVVRGEGRIRSQIVDQPHLPKVLLAANDLNAGVDSIVEAQQAAVPKPPEISQRVTEKMGTWLSPLTYSSLSWKFGEQGQVTAEFKGAVLEDALEGADLVIGDLLVVAQPAESAGIWNISAQMPPAMALVEGETRHLDVKGEGINFGLVWAEEQDRHQGSHLSAQSLELSEAKARFLLRDLDAAWRETLADNGRAQGQFSLKAASMSMGEGEALNQNVGELVLAVDYEDYDINTLEEVMSRFEQADGETFLAEADQSLHRLITALGNYSLNFSLNDLNLRDRYGRTTFNLANLQVETRSGVGADDTEGRNSFSRYRLEGLNFVDRNDGINAERLQFSVSVSGFKPQLLSKLMKVEELTPTQMTEILTGIFSSIEVAAESGTLISTDKASPLLALNGLQMGMKLEGFDQDTGQIIVNYDHNGLSGPEIPPALVPEAAKLSVNLSQIPWSELVAGLMTDNIGAVLMAIQGKQTQLNLETLALNLPDAGLNLTGMGFLDELDPATGEPIFKAQLKMDTRRLPAVADAMREQMSEREVQEFNQFMTVVMMVAEEVEPDLHHFDVEITSRPQLMVNGKDMTPLLQ